MAPKGKFNKKPTKGEIVEENPKNAADWGKISTNYYNEDGDSNEGSEFDGVEDELEMIDATRSKRMKDADYELDIASDEDDSEEDGSEDGSEIDEDASDLDMDEMDDEDGEDGDEDDEDAEAMIAGELEDIAASLLANRPEVDMAGLSASEAKKVLSRDAAELKSVLEDTERKLRTLKTQILPMIEKIQNGELKKSGRGVTYLETKAQLLLSYLVYLAFYVSLRARGKSLKDHPVIESLVQTRTLLEKLTALDERLAPQIDRIIARGDAGAVAAPAPGRLATKDEESDLDLDGEDDFDEDEDGSEDEDFDLQVADEDASDDEDEEDEGEASDASASGEKYKAPFRMATEVTGTHLTAKQRAERDLERAKARLRNSEAAKLLRQELDVAPEQIGGASLDSRVARQLEKARQMESFEEETFNRVRLTKKQRQEDKRNREVRGLMTGAGDMVDDLADIADDVILAANARKNNFEGDGAKGQRSSSFGAFLNAAAQAQKAAETAAEAVKQGAEDMGAYKTVKRTKMHEMDEVEARRQLEKEDAAKEAKVAAKRAAQKERAMKHMKPLRDEEQDREKEDEVADKRSITYQMEKNKGLTRHRKKTDGNARVHNRQKYEKKLKLLAKPKAREGSSSGNYGGEGQIRTDLIKSKKLS